MNYDVRLPRNIHPDTPRGFRALIFVNGARKRKRFYSIAEAIEWCKEMGEVDGRGYEPLSQDTKAPAPAWRRPKKYKKCNDEGEDLYRTTLGPRDFSVDTIDLSAFPVSDMGIMEHRKQEFKYITPFSLAVELGIEIPDDYMPELKYR